MQPAQGFTPRIAAIAKALLFPSVVNALGPLGKNLVTDAWWTLTVPFKSSLTGTDRPAVRQRGSGLHRPAVAAVDVVQLRGVRDRRARAQAGIGDPHDHQAVADAIGKSQGEVMTGKYDFTSGPVKNVSNHPDYMAQWQTEQGPEVHDDLLIVNNAADPTVPIDAKLLPL